MTFRTISESQGKVVDVETKAPVGAIPKMDEMLDFFSDASMQPRDRGTIIHGDYKIDNLVYHATEPKVIGILEYVSESTIPLQILIMAITDCWRSWEMSTVGHPLSDLVNLVTPWTVTNNMYGITAHQTFDTSRVIAGLPTMNQCIEWYRQVAGWDPAPDIPWGAAFWLFRTTVVMQGIAARYASRQASGTTAEEFGSQMIPHAKMAVNHIAKVKRKPEDIEVVKSRL